MGNSFPSKCFALINIVPLIISVTRSIFFFFLHLSEDLTDHCSILWFCVFFSLKKSMSLSVRTGRPFTPAVSLWAQRSVQSSETASMMMGTGQWTSGQRAKEENLHTISLWGELEKVMVSFQVVLLHRNYENGVLMRVL